jgi:hypothetical protein
MEDQRGKWLINIDLPYYFCTTAAIFPLKGGRVLKYKNPGYTVQMPTYFIGYSIYLKKSQNDTRYHRIAKCNAKCYTM